jgi:hypothetical protein
VQNLSLQIGSDTVEPAVIVHDLGVHLDSALSMKQDICKVTACSFFLPRHMRGCVGQDVTTRLVLALVASRLDYCNSALACLAQSTIEPLQRVQNAAARMLLDLDLQEHGSPSLIRPGRQCSTSSAHSCTPFT